MQCDLLSMKTKNTSVILNLFGHFLWSSKNPYIMNNAWEISSNLVPTWAKSDIAGEKWLARLSVDSVNADIIMEGV